MKINGNAIRPGNVIEHQGRLWRAVRIQHTQPGKGGAYLQVELRDIRDGTKLNERFRSSESVEKVRLNNGRINFYSPMATCSPSWTTKPMNKFPFQRTS